MKRMETLDRLKEAMADSSPSAILCDIAKILALTANEADKDGNEKASLDILLCSSLVAQAGIVAKRGGF